ncbi:MAG TPA: hypothetical protein ENK43_13515 [Planctomycetes bacterium]|nr:hypothetical protein [Planctomycetota bacterium]
MPKTVSRTLVVLLIAISAPSLIGQYVYGAGSAGGSGVVPAIASPQAYLGNANFGISISDGAPGAGAYLATALLPSVGNFVGVPLNVDINNLFSLTFLTLDAQGKVFLPAPLSAFTNPALAGFNFYAQAFVLDPSAPGGVAASRGLRGEFTLPPLVFVGSRTGFAGSQFFVDPSIPAISNTVSGVNTNVDGAAFTSEGKSLFVVSSLTRTINYADLSGVTPVWSTIHAFGPGQFLTGIALDEENDLVWTVDMISQSSSTIVALDADPSSATFGNVLHTFPAPSAGFVGRWRMNGQHLAAITHVFTQVVDLMDLNPTSPTFGQIVLSTSYPAGPTIFAAGATDVAFTRDDHQMLVAIQRSGGVPAEVARYSFAQGAWIDHDPSTPAVDDLGPFSNPPLAFGPNPFTLAFPRYADSDWFLISGFGGAGGGWAGRVDFDQTAPGAWSFTPATGSNLNQAWFSGVDPGGTTVAVATLQNHVGVLKFFDAATMTWTGSVLLPGSGGVSGSNLGDVVWR